MDNSIVIAGLSLSLIASMLIAYGRIFRSKKTIMKESQTDGQQNAHEIRHRLLETRIAQIGAALLSAGFALQLTGNFIDWVRNLSLLVSVKFDRVYYSNCSSRLFNPAIARKLRIANNGNEFLFRADLEYKLGR